MKLLIVDDEELIRLKLRHITENSTIKFNSIETASNAFQALESIKLEAPAVILSDIFIFHNFFPGSSPRGANIVFFVRIPARPGVKKSPLWNPPRNPWIFPAGHDGKMFKGPGKAEKNCLYWKCSKHHLNLRPIWKIWMKDSCARL